MLKNAPIDRHIIIVSVSEEFNETADLIASWFGTKLGAVPSLLDEIKPSDAIFHGAHIITTHYEKNTLDGLIGAAGTIGGKDPLAILVGTIRQIEDVECNLPCAEDVANSLVQTVTQKAGNRADNVSLYIYLETIYGRAKKL